MVINVNYDIGAIENELWQAMKTAAVCPVIYANRRPSSITSATTTKAFIVVKAVTEVVDKTVFGRNICRVELYTKEMGGVKDSASASVIAKKIMAALPINTSKYTFTYLSNISLGLDNTGYDVEAYNLNVLIK